MDVDTLAAQSTAFAAKLTSAKNAAPNINWYPYASMNNFLLFQRNFHGAGRNLLHKAPHDMAVIDIGGADGDVGFFFESIGCSVDFLENPVTNFNDTLGMQHLQKALGSRSKLHVQDIDFAFSLTRQYDLAIFMGILYHLRNPLGCLTHLARHAERMIMSTRTFTRLPNGLNVEDTGAAYFWECRESNNDPTNYWAFTPTALRRCLKRSGWNVLDEFRVGEVGASDPVALDERMFVYCERVPNWRDLLTHHDF